MRKGTYVAPSSVIYENCHAAHSGPLLVNQDIHGPDFSLLTTTRAYLADLAQRRGKGTELLEFLEPSAH